MNDRLPHVRPRAGHATPLDVMMRWPDTMPIAMLHAGRFHPRWARWSILGVVSESIPIDGPDPLDIIRAHLPHPLCTPTSGSSEGVLFTGGWIVQIDYELGRIIEPTVVTERSLPRPGGTLGYLARCDDALLYDHLTEQWYVIGAPGHEIESLIEDPGPLHDATFALGAIETRQSPDAVKDAIASIIDRIAAGDIFQANLTQQLSATFSGSVRALFLDAVRVAEPWYATLLEQPGHRVVVSMSPELFLAIDPDDGMIRTRPIKGTLPSHDDPRRLVDSEKDAAELNMIIDLMRNDLGRVSDPGSVIVEAHRSVETHPTVHHGVATVAGRLQRDVTLADLLVATFPPGSVTGAPKVRAMQIIEELEPSPRGAYCGTIGFVSHSGHVGLNVAIRTIEIRDGQLRYGAGGGIVADSDPQAEYDEAMDKTAVLRRLQPHAARTPPTEANP